MLTKFFTFKRLIVSIAVVLIFLVITTKAAISSQELDMSQLTCQEFLQMDRMPQVMSVVWYSGWAAQKQGTFAFTPDRNKITEQKESLTSACESNSNDLVLNQLSY